MKILYVDQFGKTAGRDSIAQCEYIKESFGTDITVYLSDNTSLQEDKKISVNIKWGFHKAFEGNALSKAFYYLRSLRELKEYIKTEKFDIIHLQWFSLPWIEWIYVHFLKKYGKIVITVHDVIPFNVRPLEIKSLQKIYQEADLLLLHTESSRKEFLENYCVNVPIRIITQGFCLKSDYFKINKDVAREHLGIPKNSIVFLYYGTIRKSKGLNYLIQAIGKAHAENEKIVLLAGGAFQKIDPSTYENLIHEYLNDNNFYGKFDFIEMSEEKFYFSAADVLCLPYLEITQSGVAQVGLMYDLPMISSNIGEMNMVTKQGYNGELVNPGNVDELKNAIIKLANDPNLLNKYSHASCELGLNEFSLEIKAGKVFEAYKLLLEGRIAHDNY